MKTPNLNRRLVLERPVRTPDGAGGFSESWQVLGTLWGEISPRNSRLSNAAAGAMSVGGFRILVRAAPIGHSARPEPGQRFRMASRVLRIEGVTEAEPKGLYLLCNAEEEVAP